MSEKRRNIAKNKGSCHRCPPAGREISTLITSIANRYRSITRLELADIRTIANCERTLQGDYY